MSPANGEQGLDSRTPGGQDGVVRMQPCKGPRVLELWAEERSAHKNPMPMTCVLGSGQAPGSCQVATCSEGKREGRSLSFWASNPLSPARAAC